jgi:hypothetical protein
MVGLKTAWGSKADIQLGKQIIRMFCVQNFLRSLDAFTGGIYFGVGITGFTTLSHWPIGAMRVFQFPLAAKYCWVAKAQPLTLGSTDTDEKSPNLPCVLMPPET